MATWQPDLAPLVAKISRVSGLFRALGADLGADLGMNASMRGVLTALIASGPRAVPELARERQVSRQHVQTVMNDLLAAGLVEASANPSHRRSPRFTLTAEARRRLKLMGEREAEALAAIAPAVFPNDVAAAMRLMEVLEHELATRLGERTRS